MCPLQCPCPACVLNGRECTRVQIVPCAGLPLSLSLPSPDRRSRDSSSSAALVRDGTLHGALYVQRAAPARITLMWRPRRRRTPRAGACFLRTPSPRGTPTYQRRVQQRGTTDGFMRSPIRGRRRVSPPLVHCHPQSSKRWCQCVRRDGESLHPERTPRRPRQSRGRRTLSPMSLLGRRPRATVSIGCVMWPSTSRGPASRVSRSGQGTRREKSMAMSMLPPVRPSERTHPTPQAVCGRSTPVL